MVELPGVENYERARNYLQAQANLEFWNVYRITDNNMISLFSQANERLRQIQSGDTSALSEEVELTKKDTIVQVFLLGTGILTGVQTLKLLELPKLIF